MYIINIKLKFVYTLYTFIHIFVIDNNYCRVTHLTLVLIDKI